MLPWILFGLAAGLCVVLTIAYLHLAHFRIDHLGYRRAERYHLQGVKTDLAMMRARCSESIANGEQLVDEPAKAFAREVGWGLLRVEEHLAGAIKAMDEVLDPVKPNKPGGTDGTKVAS